MNNQQNQQQTQTGKSVSLTVSIPNVRFIYVKAWKPDVSPNGVKNYGACILINKEDRSTVESIQRVVEAARDWGVRSYWGGQMPDNLRIPVKDGDAPDKAGKEYGATFANKWYIDAKTNRPVKIYNKKRELLTDPGDFRSGDYGVAVVTFKPYNKQGNIGISAYLEGILKTGDSDGTVSAEAALDAYFDQPETAPRGGNSLDFLGL